MSENSCLTCALAKWDRTANGRLHPSGDGRCQWKMPEITLPKGWRFFVYRTDGGMPAPMIDRRKPHKDCPQWVKAEKDDA